MPAVGWRPLELLPVKRTKSSLFRLYTVRYIPGTEVVSYVFCNNLKNVSCEYNGLNG